MRRFGNSSTDLNVMSDLHSPNDLIPPPDSQGERIFQLAELSYQRLDEFDRNRTVVIFAVSPLEEHGTHLPVGTDLFEAEFFSRELARRITDRMPGWTVLIGPSLPVGASVFERAGTLRVRARTLRRAAQDYGAALARHGFKYILLMNAHAGPRHILALEQASAAVSSRYNARMVSLSGPVLWRFLRGKYTNRLEDLIGRGLTLDEREAMRGDAHAGLWETSLLLRARPELVSGEYRSLTPQRFPLVSAVIPNYPLWLGNRKGYIGNPAAAHASWGEAARQLLLDAAWEFVAPALDAQNENWQPRSLFRRLAQAKKALPYAVGAGIVAAGIVGVGALGFGALLWGLSRWRRS
jgi:creatinine amidohydrolase